jgi:hypothetical protein
MPGGGRALGVTERILIEHEHRFAEHEDEHEHEHEDIGWLKWSDRGIRRDVLPRGPC